MSSAATINELAILNTAILQWLNISAEELRLSAFISAVITVALVGGVTTQALSFFFKAGREDRFYLLLVAYLLFGLFIEAGINITCIVRILKNLDNYASIARSDLQLSISEYLVAILTSTTACNAFFAFRARKMSNQNKWLAAALIILNAIAVIVGLLGTISGINNPVPKVATLQNFMLALPALDAWHTRFLIYAKLWVISTVSSDLLICTSLVYQLSTRKTGYHATDSVLRKLSWLTMECMIPPTASLLAFAIVILLNFSMAGAVRIAGTISCPLYVNAVIWCLMSREKTRAMLQTGSNNEQQQRESLNLTGLNHAGRSMSNPTGTYASQAASSTVVGHGGGSPKSEKFKWGKRLSVTPSEPAPTSQATMHSFHQPGSPLRSVMEEKPKSFSESDSETV